MDGAWVQSPAEVVEGVLRAMGATPAGPGPARLLVGDGDSHVNSRLRAAGIDPGALAPGELTLADGTPVLVPPARLQYPEPGWGWSCQLYALRSPSSWGHGDLADLRRLGERSSGELGSNWLLVNPLYAASPGLPQEASPYLPATRLWLSPLYLRLEEVAGWDGATMAGFARAGRALNSSPLIERDQVYRLKMAALEAIWSRGEQGLPAEAWDEAEEREVEAWATFCVLSEANRGPWRDWPPELRRPASAAVKRFAAAHRARVDFHKWVQLQLELQLQRAAATTRLVWDLALGASGSGFDAWAFQGTLLESLSLGAPPDPFNRAGQIWGLPPFDPWRLGVDAYAPFRRVLHHAFRRGHGVRVDHVMGLFRQYWVPQGADPALGVYVRFPHRELLAALLVEAQACGAFVIGEDLGTVQPWVRAELSRRGILASKLMYFEPDPPSAWPEGSVASATTHDLPTLAGLWSGSDPDPEMRRRLAQSAGLDEAANVDAALAAAYRALGQAGSRLVLAQMEDPFLGRVRPNRPGLGPEAANWRHPLPAGPDEFVARGSTQALARWLRR